MSSNALAVRPQDKISDISLLRARLIRCAMQAVSTHIQQSTIYLRQLCLGRFQCDR